MVGKKGGGEKEKEGGGTEVWLKPYASYVFHLSKLTRNVTLEPCNLRLLWAGFFYIPDHTWLSVTRRGKAREF